MVRSRVHWKPEGGREQFLTYRVLRLSFPWLEPAPVRTVHWALSTGSGFFKTWIQFPPPSDGSKSVYVGKNDEKFTCSPHQKSPTQVWNKVVSKLYGGRGKIVDMTCGLAQMALAPAKVFQDSTKTVNSCSRLVTTQHPGWESVFVKHFKVDLNDLACL